ncbi:MAG: PAS domain-containing protein [Verrucomicrobia bacterium]|nr:PAS domain-containing protein [Verrucomicrobiota bacterium]
MNHCTERAGRGLLKRERLCAAAIAFLFSILFLATPSSSATADPNLVKSVLVLYGERLELPGVSAIQHGLNAALRSDPKVDIFSEILDSARFPTAAHREEMASHLKARYGGKRFDLVVAVAGSGLKFVLDHREKLFPGVPIVFCGVEHREIEGRALPPDVKGLPITFDFQGTLELALQLQPETREVVCVAGTAPFDRLWAEQCRLVLEGYRGRVRSRFIGEGPIAETFFLLHGLPADTVVLYLDVLRDGQGQSLIPLEVLGQVVQQSNVAVYGLATLQLAQGIVGGSLFDFSRHGEETGRLCQKVLADERLDPGSLQPASPDELAVNWQALQKWGIPQNRIPRNATIHFRPPSLWREHRRAVLIAIAVALLQSALILVLMRSLRRQRKTRRALDDRLRFERLIAVLSTKFVNVPPEAVDAEIETALDEVTEAMKLERCALYALGEGTGFRLTHQRQRPDTNGDPFPLAEQDWPWLSGRISAGNTVVLHNVSQDLPEAATPERAFCRTFGLRSVLAFPLYEGDQVARALLYTSTTGHPDWPEDMLPLLQSIGQIFASALARRGAEERSRESEATLSLAALSADLGLWSWDLQTNKVWVTERARAMYDWAPGAEITFPRFLERVHVEDRPLVEKAIEQALTSREDYHLECRITRQDGNIRCVAARGRATYDGVAQPVKMMGASFDVTERKRRESEIETHRQELAHLSRLTLMGELAASLAHELNQPLTAIASNAAAGQRFIDRGEVDPQELRELLADIVSDGERAVQILRGIRDMVKKGNTTRKPVDLNRVVLDVVRLTKVNAVSCSCTVVTELEPGLPLVHADPIQLHQVLLNLVLNGFEAIDKVPIQQRRLMLSTNADADRSLVHATVRDFGPGLSEAARARIFEPFFSTKQSGLGMGLAIARSIVESFGGMLYARNARGGGALFGFTLPAYTEQTP